MNLCAGLNEEQAQAVHTEQAQVFVHASAGGGKTRVLVERYLQALQSGGYGPEEIVAITYTRKAAQELQTRIVKRLRETQHPFADRVIDLGNITTIDGFCRKLLAEYAIDVGLNPKACLIDADISQILYKEQAQALLESCYDEECFQPLFQNYAPSQLSEALIQITETWRHHTQSLSTHASRQIQAEELAELKLLQAEILKEDPECGAFDWTPLEAYLKNPHSGSQQTKVLMALDFLGRKGGNIRRKAVREASCALRTEAQRLLELVVDQATHSARTAFVELAQRYSVRLNLYKQERGLIDFADLISLTLKLANYPQVRTHLQSRFRYFLIDEYQDTNPLQSRLMQTLFQTAALFAVGDIRQAIYSFRHADSRIFLKALQAPPTDHAKVLNLKQNYRAGSEIVSFIDLCFSDEEALPEFRFEGMQARAQQKGSVECLFQSTTEKQPLSEHREREAQALSTRIRHGVTTEAAFQYRDVAILLRNRTALEIYEKALREKGIPYHVVKGKGFYDKSEVRDCLHALSALESPEEDVLMAVLKSPLVGVSDDALMLLRTQAPTQPFVECLHDQQLCEALVGEDREKIKRFNAWFDVLRQERHSLGVRALLERVLRVSNFECTVLGQAQGTQRYLNIMKLKEKARQYERLHPGALGGFIRFIQSLDVQDIEEQEAAIVEEGNAVQIMTIHAAKGLEFPVVCVAGLGDPVRQRPPAALSTNDKMCVLATHPYQRGFLRGQALNAWQAQYGLQAMREEKRLLYVAMTRAKERLILSGSQSEGEKSTQANSWMTWIRCKAAAPSDLQPTWEKRAARALPTTVHLEQRSEASETDTTVLVTQDIKERPYHETVYLSITRLLEVTAQEARHTPGEAHPHAKQMGILFHEMMQDWDFHKSAKHELERLMTLNKARLQAEPQMAERLTLAFERFTQHGLWRELVQAETIYRELPFFLRVSDAAHDLGFLVGQADLLYGGPQGWTLVDYKTGVPHAHHMDQVRLYAYCLEALLNAPVQMAYLYYAGEGRLEQVVLSTIRQPSYSNEVTRRFTELREAQLAEVQV